MSSFFTLPGSAAAKKRKRTVSAFTSATGRSKKAKPSTAESQLKRHLQKVPADEDISSEEENKDDVTAAISGSEDGEESAGETAAEKRLRLAQQYLDNLREEVGRLCLT